MQTAFAFRTRNLYNIQAFISLICWSALVFILFFSIFTTWISPIQARGNCQQSVYSEGYFRKLSDPSYRQSFGNNWI